MDDFPDRIVSEPERQKITGYSSMHWRRLEKKGLVPRRIRLGENRVGWRLSELMAWLDKKTAERDAEAGAAA